MSPDTPVARRLLVAVVALLGLVAAAASCSNQGATSSTTTTTHRTTTSSSSTTTTEAPGEVVDAGALVVGNCFDQRVVQGQGLASPNQIVRIDCSLPHDNEIYTAATMPQAITAPYPGPDTITAFANKACYNAFHAFIGERYELSRYSIGYLTPTEQTWGLPDRRVLCFVFDRGGKKLSGSARGTKQ